MFKVEYGTITEGQRSPKWVEGHAARLRLHLIPYFGEMGVSEINEGTAQEYRVHRIKSATADDAEGAGKTGGKGKKTSGVGKGRSGGRVKPTGDLGPVVI